MSKESSIWILDIKKFNEIFKTNMKDCGAFDIGKFKELEYIKEKIPMGYTMEELTKYYEETGLTIRHEVEDEKYFQCFTKDGSFPNIEEKNNYLCYQGIYEDVVNVPPDYEQDICIYTECDDIVKETGVEPT